MTASTSQPTNHAAEIMSAPLLAVEGDMGVIAAWNVMARAGVRHLLVTRGGRCVGVIDERRLLTQCLHRPKEAQHSQVSNLLRANVWCVHRDTPVSHIAQVMVKQGIEAVPVVDSDGEVVGIVTITDLLAHLARGGAE